MTPNKNKIFFDIYILIGLDYLLDEQVLEFKQNTYA